MTEFMVCHIENAAHYVLDTWSNQADARAHLGTLIDCAVNDGAIVSIPARGGMLLQDAALVEVVESGAAGEYRLGIIEVRRV